MATSVELIDVSFRYDDGGPAVVEGLSLAINPQEIVAVVGPTGAGKSTVLRLIGGFTKPQSGDVLINGHRVAGPGRDRGFIFQQLLLFPWLSVEENILFPLRLHAPRASLQSLVNTGGNKPTPIRSLVRDMGLEEHLQFSPAQLSGGLRQRVALLRSIVTEPDTLLMDEPFSALDAQTRSAIQLWFLDFWSQAKKAVVFVTHDIEEALLIGHRVVVLSGRPTKVLKDFSVPERFHNRAATFRPDFNAMKQEIWELLASQIALRSNAS